MAAWVKHRRLCTQRAICAVVVEVAVKVHERVAIDVNV